MLAQFLRQNFEFIGSFISECHRKRAAQTDGRTDRQTELRGGDGQLGRIKLMTWKVFRNRGARVVCRSLIYRTEGQRICSSYFWDDRKDDIGMDSIIDYFGTRLDDREQAKPLSDLESLQL